ncbi:chemotaxis protein CheA [Paenibacillus sp. YSY-4.3]
MSDFSSIDTLLEMFIFETSTLLEQLEQTILDCEQTKDYGLGVVNEIFRIMHTIKGSSTMMEFHNISTLAHVTEDLFSFIRERQLQLADDSAVSELMLGSIDFMKVEMLKIKNGDPADGDASFLIEQLRALLEEMKQSYGAGNAASGTNVSVPDWLPVTEQEKSGPLLESEHSKQYTAVLRYDEGCEMENLRAYQAVTNLQNELKMISHVPEDLLEDEKAVEQIRREGLRLSFQTDKTYDQIYQLLHQISYVRSFVLEEQSDLNVQAAGEFTPELAREHHELESPVLPQKEVILKAQGETRRNASSQQSSFISVHIAKLDELMDLVGELVIAEAMVTQNPDLQGLGLELEQFQKASRHLRKITSEMQDMVMSIRMIPLSGTFQRMHRIVRDMGKKLGKDVRLNLVGEDTEVDKNIIDHIADPIMHMVRNAIDHGLESGEDRTRRGKPAYGTLTLEASHAGGEVLIRIKDDGRGLDKEKLLQRARQNNLLVKNESEMTDKEIYSLIFLPGFSTKDQITEFSGRGVGMDVVTKNIESVGGIVTVDSALHEGTAITIKIPLTLAIIDGMNVRVGESRYTLPTTAIKESFRPKASDIITDPEGGEMIMVRGQCYSIVRLHQRFGVQTEVTGLTQGILIMVEQNDRQICIFADELIGQQQVVVKALPPYINNLAQIEGVSGCTLLGDGNISLILDVQGLLNGN